MIVHKVYGQIKHCGQISRMLRSDHAAAIVGLGYKPHRELRAMFESSSFCRALIVDGRLAALGGVVGPALASEGHVWLALSSASIAHPRMLLTQARAQFRELATMHHALFTTILADDAPAMNFARHLGFVPHNIVIPSPGLIPMRLDLRS